MRSFFRTALSLFRLGSVGSHHGRSPGRRRVRPYDTPS